jgi:hypothetical protein
MLYMLVQVCCRVSILQDLDVDSTCAPADPPVARLNQDVAMLELQPTLEDVFHADTTSVEDYLQQIQDMTILTAIQVTQSAATALIFVVSSIKHLQLTPHE